jgi:putative oxidoreductase
MRRYLLHPWLTVRTQIALGLVFLIAALGKVADPPAFAKAIWNYQLLPPWSVHPLALVLPWLELLCGLALCLGLWTRAAASWILALLLTFTVALSINLARHHPVDCGCFHLNGPAKTEAERLVDLRWSILRDLGLILLATQILVATRQPRPE